MSGEIPNEDKYIEFADSEWDKLEALRTKHMASWKKSPKADSIKVKEDQLVSLNKDLQELIASYHGPAFKRLGDTILGGSGDPEADIVILSTSPCCVSSKQREVYYKVKSFKGKGFYASKLSKVKDLLMAKGLDNRLYYGTFMIPMLVKGTPPQLITDLFLSYVRRRIEIISPVVLLCVGSYTSKVVDNDFSTKKLDQASPLYTGKTRRIILGKIGSPGPKLHLLTGRMIDPWTISMRNRDNMCDECRNSGKKVCEHNKEKICKKIKEVVDPLVNKLKSETHFSVERRLHGGHLPKIDGLTLLSKGVRVTSGEGTLRKVEGTLRKVEGTLRKVEGMPDDDENDRSMYADSPLVYSNRVNWIVQDSVGLVTPLTIREMTDFIKEEEINLLIDPRIGGQYKRKEEDYDFNHSDDLCFTSLSSVVPCSVISMEITPDFTEKNLLDELGFWKFVGRSMYVPNITPAIPLDYLREFIMGICEPEGKKAFSFPKILIVDSGERILNKAHLIAWIVLIILRDAFSKEEFGNGVTEEMKKTLKKKIEKEHIRKEEESSEEDDSLSSSPADVSILKEKAVNILSQFLDRTWVKGDLKVKNETRFSGESEVYRTMEIIDRTRSLRDHWGGFSSGELKYVRKMYKYWEARSLVYQIKDIPKEREDEACQEERGNKRKAMEKGDGSITDSFPTKASKTSTKHSEISQYAPKCNFCHCSEHGHKDYVMNECKEGCETRFKYKAHFEEVEKEREQALKAGKFLSLLDLCTAAIGMEALVPQEIDEIDVESKQVLPENYLENLPSLMNNGCSCPICKGIYCS